MSAQTPRFQPYPQSTPRNSAGRNQTNSLQGLNNHQGLRPFTGSTRAQATTELSGNVGGINANTLDRPDVTDHSDILERILQQITVLTDKVNQLETKVDQLHNNVDRVTHKVDRVGDQVEEVSSAVQSLRTQASALTATNSATPTALGPWTISAELKERVYTFAYHSVNDPAIDAYTALEDLNGDWLTNSLFNTVKQRVLAIGGDWILEHLPRKNNGVQDVAACKIYNTLIKDADKHARERMHNLVLTNIRNPRDPNPPEGTVPSIKRLVHRIATRCGRADEIRDIETLWNATSWAHRLRVAYLRREALRVVRVGGNIWSRVDKQLLRLKDLDDPVYSSAFYKLVYEQDCAWFDGNTRFTEFPADLDFDLPSDDDVQEEINRMQAAEMEITQE